MYYERSGECFLSPEHLHQCGNEPTIGQTTSSNRESLESRSVVFTVAPYLNIRDGDIRSLIFDQCNLEHRLLDW